MLEQPLLHTVPGLQLLDLTVADHSIVFALAAVAAAAACPLCNQPSQRIHSRYSRRPADLPWADCAVHYALQVRRFFCDNAACRRRIFAERFGPALRAYARRTTLLATRLQELGLTTGGAVGAALATLVGTPISPSTLLRLVRRIELPPLPTPRVLSMDDFAFRKGQLYGTILVDLERHYPVDLLPDRESATVAAWLRDHPGVEIISRDRASGYAQAARDGAPEALQIADRYHLFANLGDALQRLVDRHPAALTAMTEQVAQLTAAAGVSPASAVLPPEFAPVAAPLGAQLVGPPMDQRPDGALIDQADRAQEPAHADPQVAMGAPFASPSLAAPTTTTASPAVARRFAAIKDVQAQGWGQREIARRLGVHRRTVRRYMVVEAPPIRAVGPQSASKARAYLPYLRRRWTEGCRNAVVLWAELQQQGFSGSYNSIYRLVVQRLGQPSGSGPRKRASGGAGATAPPGLQPEPKEVKPLTARAARWLLARRPNELPADEEQQRALLCTASPAVAVADELAHRFAALLRDRQPEGLEPWIRDAKRSGVAELRNFAKGIERD